MKIYVYAPKPFVSSLEKDNILRDSEYLDRYCPEILPYALGVVIKVSHSYWCLHVLCHSGLSQVQINAVLGTAWAPLGHINFLPCHQKFSGLPFVKLEHPDQETLSDT